MQPAPIGASAAARSRDQDRRSSLEPGEREGVGNPRRNLNCAEAGEAQAGRRAPYDVRRGGRHRADRPRSNAAGGTTPWGRTPGPSHAPPPPCAGGIAADPGAPDMRNRGSPRHRPVGKTVAIPRLDGAGRDLGFDDEPRVRMVEVPLVVGDVLEVPDDLAGVGVEGEGRVGVQDVAVTGAPLHRAPRNRHPDAGVDEVQPGVEAGRVPSRAAPPVLVGDVGAPFCVRRATRPSRALPRRARRPRRRLADHRRGDAPANSH